MAGKKRILVCPMDWGLGHATRIVPVIRLLLESGAEVVLGADNQPLAFLRQQFPQLAWIRLPGFRPVYHKKGSLTLKMALAVPEMLSEAEKGHQLLEKIVDKEKIDAVISDNRYELWSAKVPTVFITHQLDISLPSVLATGRPLVKKLIYGFIKKHNELWVPDFEGESNLSGKLSHVKKMPLPNTFFIGPLSRFENVSGKLVTVSAETLDVLCLLSGPEPQRTIFEELLLGQLKNSRWKSVLLSGKPGENKKQEIENLVIYPHATDEKMLQLMLSAKTIVCRSGYSSLMDLTALGKRAIFVPTPGQPEQEYLARKMKKEGRFYAVSQKEFDLEKAIKASENYRGLQLRNDYLLLKERIHLLMGQ